MRRAEIIAALILIALSIGFMNKSAELDIGWIPDEGPGGGFWPFWLSALMAVSAIWILINAVLGRSVPSQSDEPFFDSYGIGMFTRVGLGLVAFVVLIEVIGMHLAAFAFMIYYIRLIGRRPWKTTLAVAIPTPVFIFLFFDVTLRKIMPTGMIDDWYIPLYAIFM